MTEYNFSGPDFLSVKEAAGYLGVSSQTLRRWDETGKLCPVRHPANGYRYYRRSDLEPFRLQYRQAQNDVEKRVPIFSSLPADVEDNGLLREPQREAHR